MLQENPSLVKNILDGISEAVFIHDASTGEVLDVNQAMLDLFGCSEKKEVLGLLGDRFSLGEPPYSMDEVAAWIRKAATQGPQLFRWRSRRMDGSLFWSEVSLTAVDDHGTPYIVAVIRDITNRIGQEAQLKTSYSRYRALFEKEDRDVLIFRPVESGDFLDFMLVDLNCGAERAAKVERQDLIGKSMLEIFPGARRAGLVKAFRKVWKSGTPSSHPLTISEEGRITSWRDMEISRLPTGEIAAISQDRTREKQTEEALRYKESVLQAILEALPAAVTLVDARRRTFKWISPYIETITGFKPEELIGHTPRRLYGSEEEYLRVGRAYKLFELQDIVEVETQFISKDGSRKEILLKAVNREDEVLCVMFDITDRKRSERDRREMERHLLHVQKLESLGVLAGGIAHDFNNLLMGILGNTELLSMLLEDEPKTRKHLEAIERAAERAAGLCGQMLAYSGQASYETEPLDISTVIKEMQGILQVSIGKGIIINFRLASELPKVNADPSQMSQILMNLVINASEAIGERAGLITITTGTRFCTADDLATICIEEQLYPGDYVFIEVSDNGCGMEEDERKRIFEPFFTTKFTGRGLGMAAVHGIIRAHHGGIEIESERGEGTTIRILLPTMEMAERIAETDSAHLGGLQRPGVLLVDDEPEIRALGSQMLKMMGYMAMVAENGIEAVNTFKRHRGEIACVVLDLTMPEMDGQETLMELKRMEPGVKVIISSGYETKEVARRFAGLGVSGYLKKPYRFHQLSQILQSVIAS